MKDAVEETVKILIVDDEPDLLFATSRVVKSCGYAVYEATTGKEGLAAARRHKPDIILLDVVLPDADGIELSRKLKEDPETKASFLVLTSGSRTASTDQAEGLDMGADGYITRPITNQELKARVNAIVRILKAERERDRVIQELQQALAKIKRLRGLLPICMFCKKIRDDKGYWNQLETYIHEHSEADFSHSICPVCYEENYPEPADD